MSVIKNSKALVRKELRRRLLSLSDEVKKEQSNIVFQKLLKVEAFKKSQRISLYLNMQDEIHTEDILHHLLTCKKDCFIPHFIGPNMKMVRLKSWEDYQQLPSGKWNIKQPHDSEIRENALDTGGLDLILMPGLGFTKNGDRLGRGKGYYDTFLSKCSSLGLKPITIALAYNEQICDQLPVEDTDITMDMVLFPACDDVKV